MLGLVNRDMPAEAIVGPVWLMASALTLVALLVVGIPAFLLLRLLNRSSSWAAALIGAIVGLLLFVFLSLTVLEGFGSSTGVGLTLTGAVVGSLFHLITRIHDAA
jgi:hypothetical protein